MGENRGSSSRARRSRRRSGTRAALCAGIQDSAASPSLSSTSSDGSSGCAFAGLEAGEGASSPRISSSRAFRRSTSSRTSSRVRGD